MHLRLFCFSVLLTIILTGKQTSAQHVDFPGAPFIQHFLPGRDYQGHTQVWFALQDKRGIMYFGTSDNLLIYDGSQWRSFVLKSKSIIRCADMDENGRIYLGGLSEFGYIYYESTGRIKFKTLIHKIPKKYKSFNDIWNVYCAKDGTYFETEEHFYKYANDTIQIVNKSSGFVCCEAYNEIYQVDNNEALKILDNDRFFIMPKSDGIGLSNVGSKTLISPYKKNDLLLIAKNGMYVYKRSLLIENDTVNYKKNIDENIIQPLHNEEIVTFLNENYAYMATQINDTTYAIATAKGGLILMDDKGNLINNLNKNKGLTSNMLFYAFKDDKSNLWLTSQKGINFVFLNTPIYTYGEEMGLNEYVLSITKKDNRLYAGCYDGCYYLEKFKFDEHSKEYAFKKLNNSNFPAWDFIHYKNSLISTSEGVAQIKNNNMLRISKHHVYSFHSNPNFPEYLFFCTTDGFIGVKMKKTPKLGPNGADWTIVDTCFFDEIESTTRTAVLDTNNNFWITSEANGIYKIEFEGNNIENHKIYHIDTSDGLPHMYIPFTKRIDDNILTLTDSGVYKISGFIEPGSQKKFLLKPYGFFNKLIGKRSIYKIKKDKHGNYYTILRDGFLMLRKNNNQYTVDSNRFQNINYIEKIHLTDNDRIVWLHGKDGIYRFDNRKKQDIETPYKTIIRKVVINNVSLIYDGNHPSIPSKKGKEKNFDHPDCRWPTISFENNAITFSFAAIWFEYPGKTKYSFKLEGFDEDWSKWSNNSKKEYTYLREGKYTFKVKAKNIYNNESEIAIYKFRILPPWYRTNIAYIIYVILFILLFWLALKLNTLRLKKAKRKLETIVDQRTIELRNKNQEIESINKEVMQQYSEIQQQNAEILQQKEQLEFVNQELEKLSIVAKETTNAVVIADTQGNFEWVNNGFEILYNTTLKKLKSNELANVFKFYQQHKGQIAEHIQEHRSITFQSKRVSKKNTDIYVQTTITPVIDTGNKLYRIVAIDIDITSLYEARRLKRDLAVSNEFSELRRRFLANMGHEMRTPMNGIIGMSEILTDTCNSSDQKEMATIINSSAKSLMHIINDILEISKIEAGKMKLQSKHFKLPELIEQARILFDATARSKNLKLGVEKPESFPFSIVGDKLRVMQVLSYLLSNAVKFTEKGEITMRYNVIDEENGTLTIKIEVIDTGIGLTEEQKNIIFEKFLQGDTSDTRKYEGIGLGLSIAKDLVEIMQGEIDVASKQGEGSNFWFTFKARKAGEKENKEINAPQLNMKFLVLDPSQTNRKILDMILRRTHSEVYTATSILQAIRLMKNHKFNHIFLGFQLHGLNYKKLVTIALKYSSSIPVIWQVVENQEDENNVIQEYINEYISPPFESAFIYEKLLKY